MIKILYIFFVSIIVTNCSLKEVSEIHGVPFLEKKQASLIINKTNKNDIKRILGNPSTKSKFDNDIWIYIERKQTQSALRNLGKMKINENNVLVLEINNYGILTQKKFYNKEIHVIYNPTKDVFFNSEIKKTNKFLYVGRANDPIKRIKLLSDMSIKNPLIFKDLKICGTENPGFGKYLGVVSDEKLNEYYNSSKFLLLPSRAEGLGLTMIEGLICGCIPITCSDNLTAKEFSPIEFICEPSPNVMIKKIEELNEKYTEQRTKALKIGKKYKIQFDKITIAKNIINIFNSR